MKNYCIDFTTIKKYFAVVYSASYINPFNNLDEISLELQNKLNCSGYLLFDLLLSNGDCFNRFAEVYFDGKEIKLDTTKVVALDDETQLKTINAHYRGRTSELNNSVLSKKEAYKYAII